MRITFVLPYAGTAGGTRAVAIYADRLTRRGHTVVVVSLPRQSPGLRKTVQSVLRGRGLPKRSSESHFDHVNVDHRVVDSYRPIVDADLPDADVVIATWWETAEWVWKLSPSKGKKFYFCQHHEVVFQNQPVERVAATWRLPMQKIVCAKWLADVARDEYGDPNAIVVPYGLDHDQFHAPPRGKQMQPTVGLMYSLAAFKGTDTALAAFSLASKRIHNLQLISFGTQPALDLPPGARFQQSPPQDSLKEIYASCDAWLFPSRCEGFGLPVLEAMACRTPVIATPTGAGPEVCASGGAIETPIDDAPRMADAIERIVKLPDAKWRELSERAYQTSQRYHWDISTQLFEATLAK
jgi:glycosyltransferase involved in cell wall biosynthesis